MSDFVSDFWNLYVVVIVTCSILACALLLWVQSKAKFTANKTMGHVWDESLEEYNNPMPQWWSWLFYLTILFAVVYLVLYPGFGRFPGVLNWTSTGQHALEVKKANETINPLFAKYQKMDLASVAADKGAMEMGKRLFQTYCVQCHGSDSKGSKGFPNLTDNDWLWGSTPEAIIETISGGRQGIMPAYGGNEEAIGGVAGAKEVANYVRSLSGLTNDAALAAAGKAKFEEVCSVCHGPDGKGIEAQGAPNLTDKVWLYGSSEAAIIEGVTKGRSNQMPAWKDFLGEGKVHVLSAYVWNLSHSGAAK